MKGQIWISAVLYIAIGVVAISLILSAGLPLINKMRDRNTVMQTKELLHTFDEAIRQVASEGIGSQRVLDPVIIRGGKLSIENDKIKWQMDTETQMMEPCDVSGESCSDKKLIQNEGNIEMFLEITPVEGEYISHLNLNYGSSIKLGLSLDSKITGSLTGKYVILVKYEKVAGEKPFIAISVS